jgi:hypothetical protein
MQSPLRAPVSNMSCMSAPDRIGRLHSDSTSGCENRSNTFFGGCLRAGTTSNGLTSARLVIRPTCTASSISRRGRGGRGRGTTGRSAARRPRSGRSVLCAGTGGRRRLGRARTGRATRGASRRVLSRRGSRRCRRRAPSAVAVVAHRVERYDVCWGRSRRRRDRHGVLPRHGTSQMPPCAAANVPLRRLVHLAAFRSVRHARQPRSPRLVKYRLSPASSWPRLQWVFRDRRMFSACVTGSRCDGFTQ